MISFNTETLNPGENPQLQTSFIKFDVAMASFKNLLNMVVLEEHLKKTDIEKIGYKSWAKYQYVLNVPLWNDWSKVVYSQVHGSPVLKTPSFKSLNWISVTIFAEFIQFAQGPNLRRPRTFWKENLLFHWRKISYFSFTYIFPLVLLFIS